MHILVMEEKMFVNYANSLHDSPQGYMNKSIAVEINSAGTYRLNAKDEMETCRTNGRTDYQLIYIAGGKGFFYFKNSAEGTIVQKGNFVLYRPGEFQKYEFKKGDCAEVYWIHFTGSEIKKIFLKYGLDFSLSIFECKNDSAFAQIFCAIISEMQTRKKFFEDAAASLFCSIVMNMGRFSAEEFSENFSMQKEIDDAMNYFRKNYRKQICVEKFVESRGLGMSSFFRKFKSCTGISPLQFLLQVRISNAMNLLETTKLPVNEISLLVGYENSLYFSRLFHQHTGLSPKNWREKNSCIKI